MTDTTTLPVADPLVSAVGVQQLASYLRARAERAHTSADGLRAIDAVAAEHARGRAEALVDAAADLDALAGGAGR
jgi:hypothetical protein